MLKPLHHATKIHCRLFLWLITISSLFVYAFFEWMAYAASQHVNNNNVVTKAGFVAEPVKSLVPQKNETRRLLFGEIVIPQTPAGNVMQVSLPVATIKGDQKSIKDQVVWTVTPVKGKEAKVFFLSKNTKTQIIQTEIKKGMTSVTLRADQAAKFKLTAVLKSNPQVIQSAVGRFTANPGHLQLTLTARPGVILASHDGVGKGKTTELTLQAANAFAHPLSVHWYTTVHGHIVSINPHLINGHAMAHFWADRGGLQKITAIVFDPQKPSRAASIQTNVVVNDDTTATDNIQFGKMVIPYVAAGNPMQVSIPVHAAIHGKKIDGIKVHWNIVAISSSEKVYMEDKQHLVTTQMDTKVHNGQATITLHSQKAASFLLIASLKDNLSVNQIGEGRFTPNPDHLKLTWHTDPGEVASSGDRLKKVDKTTRITLHVMHQNRAGEKDIPLTSGNVQWTLAGQYRNGHLYKISNSLNDKGEATAYLWANHKGIQQVVVKVFNTQTGHVVQSQFNVLAGENDQVHHGLKLDHMSLSSNDVHAGVNSLIASAYVVTSTGKNAAKGVAVRWWTDLDKEESSKLRLRDIKGGVVVPDSNGVITTYVETENGVAHVVLDAVDKLKPFNLFASVKNTSLLQQGDDNGDNTDSSSIPIVFEFDPQKIKLNLTSDNHTVVASKEGKNQEEYVTVTLNVKTDEDKSVEQHLQGTVINWRLLGGHIVLPGDSPPYPSPKDNYCDKQLNKSNCATLLDDKGSSKVKIWFDQEGEKKITASIGEQIVLDTKGAVLKAPLTADTQITVVTGATQQDLVLGEMVFPHEPVIEGNEITVSVPVTTSQGNQAADGVSVTWSVDNSDVSIQSSEGAGNNGVVTLTESGKATVSLRSAKPTHFTLTASLASNGKQEKKGEGEFHVNVKDLSLTLEKESDIVASENGKGLSESERGSTHITLKLQKNGQPVTDYAGTKVIWETKPAKTDVLGNRGCLYKESDGVTSVCAQKAETVLDDTGKSAINLWANQEGVQNVTAKLILSGQEKDGSTSVNVSPGATQQHLILGNMKFMDGAKELYQMHAGTIITASVPVKTLNGSPAADGVPVTWSIKKLNTAEGEVSLVTAEGDPIKDGKAIVTSGATTIHIKGDPNVQFIVTASLDKNPEMLRQQSGAFLYDPTKLKVSLVSESESIKASRDGVGAEGEKAKTTFTATVTTEDGEPVKDQDGIELNWSISVKGHLCDSKEKDNCTDPSNKVLSMTDSVDNQGKAIATYWSEKDNPDEKISVQISKVKRNEQEVTLSSPIKSDLSIVVQPGITEPGLQIKFTDSDRRNAYTGYDMEIAVKVVTPTIVNNESVNAADGVKVKWMLKGKKCTGIILKDPVNSANSADNGSLVTQVAGGKGKAVVLLNSPKNVMLADGCKLTADIAQ